MSAEQMRRALELLSNAEKLHRQFQQYVLLKRDSYTRGETISVGEPIAFRQGEYHSLDIPLPEDARRYVFRLWRKQVAHKFNAIVRELNQIGASHNYTLIEFSQQTGEPLS